jgi:hypothetical protein
MASVVVAFYIESTGPDGSGVPLISVGLASSVLSGEENLTQGMTFVVNVTLSSSADKDLTVPLGLSLSSSADMGWLPPVPEETIFNFTYVPNPLVLAPRGSGSSVLTVVLAEDAPIGAYVFYVELGNSQETGLARATFIVNVNPKQT